MKIQNKCRDVYLIHLNTQNKRCIRNTSLQKAPSGRGWGCYGFTLVELIVVIIILAILGTIAFVSFQSYARDARDSQRMTDLANMKKVLALYITTNSEYPEPTDGEEVTYSGSEVWTQGTFGDSVRAQLGNRANLSETPYDPLTYNEYTYSVLNTKKEYQIAVVFEGEQAYNPHLASLLKERNIAQAAGAYGFTRVAGDYNGKVAKAKTGSLIYVLAVPTIINGDKTLTDIIDIINNKKLVFDKSRILPSSYRGTTNFQEKLPTGNIVNTGSIVAYQTTDLNDLQSESNQQVFIENLKNAYTDTVLVENNSTIKKIVEQPTLYVAQTIIHNEVTLTIEITATNTSSGATASTSNGIITCGGKSPGDTFEVDGVTYIVVDNQMLHDKIGSNDTNFYETACTSLVTDMNTTNSYDGGVFFGATINPDISHWDVSNVTNMHYMFTGAQAFNQDIGSWDVSNVIYMPGMFARAQAFNQDLTSWSSKGDNVTSCDSFDLYADSWEDSNKPTFANCSY